MNSGFLPLLLIFATIGLSLSLVGGRGAWSGLAAAAATAMLTSLIPIDSARGPIVFAGLWISMIAAAVAVYLPRDWPHSWTIAVVAIAGGWAGALASLSAMRPALLLALPLSLLFLPGRWFEQRGHGIAVKVAASWMIAIASLSLFVSMMPMPGYKLDHME